VSGSRRFAWLGEGADSSATCSWLHPQNVKSRWTQSDGSSPRVSVRSYRRSVIKGEAEISRWSSRKTSIATLWL